jgi:alkylated DNA repair dioxygenase AlkB
MKALFRILIAFLHLVTISAFAGSFDEIIATGNYLYSAQDYNRAIVCFQKALTSADTQVKKAITHSNLAKCFQTSGETSKVIGELEQAFVVLSSLFDEISDDDQNCIARHLKEGYLVYPSELRSRVLNAQFEMLVNGKCIAPGVSYLPSFLSEDETKMLEDCMTKVHWSVNKDKGQCSSHRFRNKEDGSKFENFLGAITDKLRNYKLLPEGIRELSFLFTSYEKGGWLCLHKDTKDRVDGFVLGISIGGPCKLDFVLDSSGQKTFLRLASQSVFVMEGEAHNSCTHGISDVEEKRLGLMLYVPAEAEKGKHPRFDIESKKFVPPPLSTSENNFFCRQQ